MAATRELDVAQRRSWRLASLAAAVAIGATVLSGCGGGKEASTAAARTTTAASTSTAEAEPTDMEDAGALAIDITGDWLAAGEGTVWLSNPPSGEVYRLDPDSGKTVSKIYIQQGPCEAGDVGFGAFWTATCGKPGLAQIDPSTNKPEYVRVPTSTTHGGEGSIGAGAGGVWVVVDTSKCSACAVARVDPNTLQVVAHVPVSPNSSSVRVGEGAVWVVNPEAGTVQEIDPERNRVVHTTEIGPVVPRFFAANEGGVWTLNQADGSVTRVDPLTGEVAATIQAEVVGDGGDMTAGGGWVWARGSGYLLTRIDPQTNAIVERYGPSSGSGAAIVGFGAVWISAHDIARVWKLPLANLK
jgi:streptogramin lyase